jgi:hypothetical protein
MRRGGLPSILLPSWTCSACYACDALVLARHALLVVDVAACARPESSGRRDACLSSMQPSHHSAKLTTIHTIQLLAWSMKPAHTHHAATTSSPPALKFALDSTPRLPLHGRNGCMHWNWTLTHPTLTDGLVDGFDVMQTGSSLGDARWRIGDHQRRPVPARHRPAVRTAKGMGQRDALARRDVCARHAGG